MAVKAATRTTSFPLTNGGAAVLGMVVLGARSGYEIRRAAELSLRFFWSLGPPQIYAELSGLEDAGLIKGRDDSTGRRPRRCYHATARGRSALAAWVTEHQAAAMELRDPLLLRLFFADVIERTEVSDLVKSIRDRSVQALAAFDDRIMPAADQTQERGFGQPRAVAQFGQDLHQFIVNWCEERLGDD